MEMVLCQQELGYYRLGLGLDWVKLVLVHVQPGSIAVGVQSARVWVMCGRAGSCACTTGVLSPPRGSTVLFEDRVFSPLDTGITRSNSNG